MRHIKTDVLVIGGGATGTGIFRDLCMRGFKSILVERRDLAYGTTGRYHGLLHSGARYAVKDPVAAKECIEENKILRKIMPQCIEDTGGYFVLTRYDDASYVPPFIVGCQKAGIPIDEIPIRQMLKEEPVLDPQILKCFQVPDASADSFLASDLNAEAARQYGGVSYTYYEVKNLTESSDRRKDQKKISGAICRDLIKDEDVQIDADLVVNATGAWAGKIANLVGINLHMVPGKGTMVALNHRIVNKVINRCKLPSDGDILVPAHTVAVMGTTDIRVSDPDHYGIEPWEIRLILDEGEKIIPDFKNYRILRAWAGIRPLINEAEEGSNRDISRSFTLIDHATRDGVEGMITITGGKWTTYRKMAQITVDKVCEKLNTIRTCKTHLEILPPSKESNKSKVFLGTNLGIIEKDEKYGQLICECELATKEEIIKSILYSDAKTIDDIRRDVRLGMGPCQAAFCAIRAAGLLHEIRRPDVDETNLSLRNFLQERWKGNLPILQGQQLRQIRLNELIYANTLNVGELPGDTESNISSENYEKSIDIRKQPPEPISKPTSEKTTTFTYSSDIIVIGAGIAGLITAWRASKNGKKVRVIAKGWGSQYWSSGCIDLFGYQPPNYIEKVDSPIGFIEEFLKSNDAHPYAILGAELIEEALSSFVEFSKVYNYPFSGSIDRNILLPTASGTLRPTCLAPFTMTAGTAHQRSPMMIVGFNNFYDFFPSLIADNLTKQDILAQDISLEIKSIQPTRFISGTILARLFDKPDFRQEVIDSLKPRLGKTGRIGFPAVLGINHCKSVIQHLEDSLGVPVFEIPGLPPSIPGMRLHNMLVSLIDKNGGTIDNGMLVSSANTDHQSITSILSEASARKLSHSANTYVLATGGILGGGIEINNDYAQEVIFNLPIDIQNSPSWFQEKFISPGNHPIFSTGINVDSKFQPTNEENQVIFDNLYAIGSSLGHCDTLRERSLEGIAISTGYKVGELISDQK